VADSNAQNASSGGAPACGWASLGNVPVAQCVPASPTFSPYGGQLSPVTAATVARLLGTPSPE
jgi:hypothetical protein